MLSLTSSSSSSPGSSSFSRAPPLLPLKQRRRIWNAAFLLYSYLKHGWNGKPKSALSLSKTLPRHHRRPKKKERKRCNIFVPVVLVISHSDAYLLRSSTPSHKMGGAKMCSGVVVRFGEKCALVWFFSHEFIRPNFLSSVVDCITKHTKRGESRALTRTNRRPRMQRRRSAC